MKLYKHRKYQKPLMRKTQLESEGICLALSATVEVDEINNVASTGDEVETNAGGTYFDF